MSGPPATVDQDRRIATPIVLTGLRAAPGDVAALVEAWVEIDSANPYLRAHFPGRTVFPGVFYIDLLDQAISRMTRVDGHPRAGLVAVESARFTAPAGAGDRIVLRFEIPHRRREGRFEVDAVFTRGDGRQVARIRATFADSGRT